MSPTALSMLARNSFPAVIGGACALLFLLTGCASSRPAPPAPAAKPVTVRQEPPPPVASVPQESAPPERSVEQVIRAEVDRYFGTPHKWGGTDERGFDCSGFTLVLYRDLFGLTLPRTTIEQVEEGTEVVEEELVPGDLVFFRPPKTRHVGIYVGNGEFAHTSSSRGVMISRLSEPYWQRAYWTSRRVLQPAAERPRTLPASAIRTPERIAPGEAPPGPAAERPATSRAGW